MRVAVRRWLQVFGAVLVPVVATTAIVAQAPIQPPKQLYVDGVVASVNESVVLQSKLFSTSEGDINGAETEQGRSLTPAEIAQIIGKNLRTLIGNYQMAQSARSFGNIPADRFEMVLRSELERDKQDLLRDLGSYLAFSEELERTGQTWPSYVESQRIEKLQMLAEHFAINERLRKQANLYLTPRMLRETFEQNPSWFVFEASAVVEMVNFSGAKAAENAAAAAAFWRTGDFHARQVADRHEDASSLLSLRAASLREPLKAFALKGPIGSVSEPVARADGTLDVIKVMEWTPASEGSFEDREVQAQVRRYSRLKVMSEFRMQALQRAQERTEVWLYRRGERIPYQVR